MRIKLEECNRCGKCCHGTAGNRIAARMSDGHLPRITVHKRCEFLSRTNQCSKGRNMPLECAWYPLQFFEGGIYVDKSCPGWESALKQFKDFCSFMPKEVKKQGQSELILEWVDNSEEPVASEVGFV